MSFVQLGSAGVQIITLLTLPCDGCLACVSTINKAKQHETHRDSEAHVCKYKGIEHSHIPFILAYKCFSHTSLELLYGLKEAFSHHLWTDKKWISRNKTLMALFKCCSGCAYSGGLSCLAGRRKIHLSSSLHPSRYFSPRATKPSIHWTVPQNCLLSFSKVSLSHGFLFIFSSSSRLRCSPFTFCSSLDFTMPSYSLSLSPYL